jgi:hypothetical protein
MTASAGPALHELRAEYSDRLTFTSLYVREAHPGNRYPQTQGLDQSCDTLTSTATGTRSPGQSWWTGSTAPSTERSTPAARRLRNGTRGHGDLPCALGKRFSSPSPSARCTAPQRSHRDREPRGTDAPTARAACTRSGTQPEATPRPTCCTRYHRCTSPGGSAAACIRFLGPRRRRHGCGDGRPGARVGGNQDRDPCSASNTPPTPGPGRSLTLHEIKARRRLPIAAPRDTGRPSA